MGEAALLGAARPSRSSCRWTSTTRGSAATGPRISRSSPMRSASWWRCSRSSRAASQRAALAERRRACGGARARAGREPREARRVARESRRADADRARPRRLPPRLRRRRRDGPRRRQHRRLGQLLQRDSRAQHAALDPSLRPSRRRRGPGPRRRRRSPGAPGLLRDRRRCDGLQHAGARDRRAPRPARRLPGLLRSPVGHGEDQPDGGARAGARALHARARPRSHAERSTPTSARSPGTASRRRWARTGSASPIPAELEPALRRCLASGRCAVVHVDVDPKAHLLAPGLQYFKDMHQEPAGA